MKYGLTWLMLPLVLGVTLIACNEDDTINPSATGPTGDVIDRGAILSNVEDVRALIEDNAESLDPMVVEDVDYSDERLRVTLAESQNNLDVSGLESMCEDVSRAIALPDMTVVVEKADGSESTECEFSA